MIETKLQASQGLPGEKRHPPKSLSLCYFRVQEKLKEIRQNFANEVTTGSRSGSGKIVLEFFYQLKQIWDGSPSTEPLSYGATTDDFNDMNESDKTVPETVPQVLSDYADIEEHTKSSASQSHSD